MSVLILQVLAACYHFYSKFSDWSCFMKFPFCLISGLFRRNINWYICESDLISRLDTWGMFRHLWALLDIADEQILVKNGKYVINKLAIIFWFRTPHWPKIYRQKIEWIIHEQFKPNSAFVFFKLFKRL